MHVFIDEAGDIGFKFANGSTRYFVVSVVMFKSQVEIDGIDIAMSRLRQQLRLDHRYEFVFNKLNRSHRLKLLHAVDGERFGYYGVILDKYHMDPRQFAAIESFYQQALELVCTQSSAGMEHLAITIDGKPGRQLQSKLERSLRHRLNVESEVVQKVTLLESKRSAALQLADMVAGSLAREYSGNTDASEYRAVIRQHEVCVQVWP